MGRRGQGLASGSRYTHGQLVLLQKEALEVLEACVQADDRVLAAHAAGDYVAERFRGHLVLQEREREEEGARAHVDRQKLKRASANHSRARDTHEERTAHGYVSAHGRQAPQRQQQDADLLE